MRQIRLLAQIGLTLALAVPAGAAKPQPKPDPEIDSRAEEEAREAVIRRLMLQGSVALDRKQYSQAAQSIEKATKLDPNSAEAFNQLGSVYYQWAFRHGPTKPADADKAEQAVTNYHIAINLDPDFKSISDPYLMYHGMAMSYQGMGKYEEAIAALKTAAHISPNNPMPALYAAAIRYEMQDYSDSSANLDLSARVAQRSGVYPMLSKLIRANPLFSDLLKLPRNQKIIDTYDGMDQGRVMIARDPKPAAARAEYRDSLRNSPAPVARRSMKDIAAQNAKAKKAIERADQDFKFHHYHEAISGYGAALNADKNIGNLSLVQKSTLYERIGGAYRKLGMIDQAIGALHKSVTELPANSGAYYQLALAYSSSGRVSQALSSLNSAFRNAQTRQDLRRIFVMAKTDSELDPLRDMPAFRKILKPFAARLNARKTA